MAFKAQSYSAISTLNGFSQLQFCPLKDAKALDFAIDISKWEM